MRKAILRSVLMIGLVPLALRAEPPSGLWSASVVVNELEIPFRLELSFEKDSAAGAFFNGDEAVRSTSGSFRDGALELRFDHYATRLHARFVDGKLTGTYGRPSKNPYRFQAVPLSESKLAEAADAPRIAGEWRIAVNSPKGEKAWRLLVSQNGAETKATILRVDGDTGVLAGSYRDGQFVLSHFSGARPSLLEITPLPDGTLRVVQNRKSSWTAVRASEAAARGVAEPSDPALHTSVKNQYEPFRFSGTDLSGQAVSESDPRFQGKVVVVNISGSWCPNCHDEAPLLAELYARYRSRGLEIVTLSFEEAEQLSDPTRLRAFIERYGLRHTVLLAGEPSELQARLPQAVNLNTWPATFFIGRDGRVRGVHAGFPGRASGEAYVQAKADFVKKVETLLSESQQTAR